MLAFMYRMRYRESGQGIVEYAMILGFVLSLAYSLHFGGLKETVSDTYLHVMEFLSTLH